jgi:hypothetical protein
MLIKSHSNHLSVALKVSQTLIIKSIYHFKIAGIQKFQSGAETITLSTHFI